MEVCYLDFSKAFDSVNHRLLLMKLGVYAIDGQIHKWLSDFLSCRTFHVRVGNSKSDVVNVTSGVPQGSVLGPLLFLLFINDLASTLSSPCFIFADDLKVVGSDGREVLAKDIAIVVDWAHKWDLPLNAGKSHLLSRALENLTVVSGQGPFTLGVVQQTKDLGITVNADLNWSDQCAAAAHKARKELFRLKSALSCRKPEVFIPLYKAVVRPHLEYCVQAWAPFFKKDAACLEKIQRLATKMVEGQKGKSYRERLKDLGLFSLEKRRFRGDLIETFKIVKGLSGVKPDRLFEKAPAGKTRGHNEKLTKFRSRLVVRSNFFSNRVVNKWNRLPVELVELKSVQAFKSALDRRWEELIPEIEY